MLEFIFSIIGIILIVGIIVVLCLGVHKRKATAADYTLDESNELVRLLEQQKIAEERYIKELTWVDKVKELCSSGVLRLTRRLPVGVSKYEHYNDIINEVYYRAKSINAEYLIIASNWLPIFCFAEDFKRNTNVPIQGSYTAGTYKGLSIIVSPCLDSFEMICGVDTETPEYNIESIDDNKFMLIKLED